MPNSPDEQASESETPITVSLTRRAEGGDESAFDELFARHYERVLRITALKLGKLLENCSEEVEDAVQFAFADTFLRLREGRIEGIHADHAFRRYVATAAANRVRSVKRSNETQLRGGGRVHAATETLFGMLGTKDPGPSTLVDLDEIEKSLEKSVLALPEAYRKAIELHCYAGMGYGEIAESKELVSPRGKAVTTADGVRIIVHRARKMLDSATGLA